MLVKHRGKRIAGVLRFLLVLFDVTFALVGHVILQNFLQEFYANGCVFPAVPEVMKFAGVDIPVVEFAFMLVCIIDEAIAWRADGRAAVKLADHMVLAGRLPRSRSERANDRRPARVEDLAQITEGGIPVDGLYQLLAFSFPGPARPFEEERDAVDGFVDAEVFEEQAVFPCKIAMIDT